MSDPKIFLPPPPVIPSFSSVEHLLAAIVDSCDDAIISKNLDGIVTSWNRGAERTFGYTEAEMIGQSIIRLLPLDRLDEEPKILARLRRGEQIDHYETVRVTKDGRSIDVSLTISPIRNSEGVCVGASKVARDITEQKRIAQKLAEGHEALIRANRMKMEFISTLSHELRTPLTAIVGWLQILESGVDRDELAQGLEVIKRNVRAQTQLINDLLDMSRIEAGKMALDIRPIDVAEVVAAALESVRPTAEAKGITLTSSLATMSGAMADKNRLQQIIWNLVTNAVKFTLQGGTVHVATEGTDSQLIITVRDNGVGIEPEYLNSIFERFSQVDSSTTRKHGGLGLGLSIAKHLSEMHGGSIAAHSAGRGKGAVFTVTLPRSATHGDDNLRRAEARNAEVDDHLRREDLRGIKILSVEDDPDAAEVVRIILTRSRAEVVTASSMQAALQRLESFVPDVLISDIGLPDHDGYELIAKVRALPNGCRIPAVALTALAQSGDRTRAIRAGFQMHIAKPVDPEELIAVVRNLVDLSTPQAATADTGAAR